MFDILTYEDFSFNMSIRRIQTHLVDQSIDTFSESIPAESLVFGAGLVLGSLGLHGPESGWWNVCSSRSGIQELGELILGLMVAVRADKGGDSPVGSIDRFR